MTGEESAECGIRHRGRCEKRDVIVPRVINVTIQGACAESRGQTTARLLPFFHQLLPRPPSRPSRSQHHGRRPQGASRPPAPCFRRCAHRAPQCPVCQSTFTRPQHVARHMRSRKWLLSPAPPLRGGASHSRSPIPPPSLTTFHSPDTGDRPYKCQHCGDQFARRSVSVGS